MDILKKLRVAKSREEIKKRVAELGKEINNYYGDTEYIVVTILKGSMFFLTDLVMYLSKKIIIDFMALSSYYGVIKNSANVKVVLDVNTDIRNKKVLVVEDIIDTGASLKKLTELLSIKQPESIEIVTLLKKRKSEEMKIHPKWIGFEIENKFVIGYGLDYKNNYRNLDFIGYLEV